MKPRRLVVISDFQDGNWDGEDLPSVLDFRKQWISGNRGGPSIIPPCKGKIDVIGGYIERLPLAAIAAGLVDAAEVWTHWRGMAPPKNWTAISPWLTRRAFRLDGPEAPFASNDMLAHIEEFGAPEILCVWGLGVNENIMLACQDSFKIYNSIDAPAIRIPFDVSRHFDLFLTGENWQSDEISSRHPHIPTEILPIGPEFASDITFRPLDIPKTYDVIYVAAAQSYKRHDILFDALARLPREYRTLCVCGYGELLENLQSQVQERGINVDFIGPPGVSFAEVNQLMNQARMGVVCGINDGAPAILTEYMLANLPVLVNSALCCGQQYITPETGRTASAENFHIGIHEMLQNIASYSPRKVALENWTWPHSVHKLTQAIDNSKRAKQTNTSAPVRDQPF